jgi:hypothetical protein
MNTREVMQMAYDALTTVHRGDFEDDCEFNYEKCWKAIKALKVELDKPEPETDTIKDRRFICSKCGSDDVKIAPMYGSSSRCCNCGHKWANP